MSRNGVKEVTGEFAERFRYLLQNLHVNGEQVFLTELAAYLAEHWVTSCTYNYLSNLARGVSENPGFPLVNGICKYFGVEPNYFSRDPTYYEQFRMAVEELKKRAAAAGEAPPGLDEINAVFRMVKDEQNRGFAASLGKALLRETLRSSHRMQEEDLEQDDVPASLASPLFYVPSRIYRPSGS